MKVIVKCVACSANVSAWNIFSEKAGYKCQIKSLYKSTDRDRVATLTKGPFGIRQGNSFKTAHLRFALVWKKNSIYCAVDTTDTVDMVT